MNHQKELLEELKVIISDINTAIQNEPWLANIPKNKILCLSDTEIEDQFTPLFKELVDKLEFFCCDNFITSEGHHSKFYYIAIKEGIKLRVTERDSFGPLIVCLTEADDKWRMYYG